MHVENTNFNSINISQSRKGIAVVSAEEIKTILFLGIKSDIPVSDPKRKVDIII